MRIHGTIYVLYKYKVMYGYSFRPTTVSTLTPYTNYIRYVYPHIYIKSATKINLPRMQYKQPYLAKTRLFKNNTLSSSVYGLNVFHEQSRDPIVGKISFWCVRACYLETPNVKHAFTLIQPYGTHKLQFG